jgi:hypothetical protein
MRFLHGCGAVLALSIGLGLCAGEAEEGPYRAPNGRQVNTINDGKIIQGGNFYSSRDGETVFKNSGTGGLWLKSGSTIRGINVGETGHATGYGGNVHLSAPNAVVRVDGNIDVSNVWIPNNHFHGSGGNLTIDAAFLYHNGNIFANGLVGGNVNINAGAATFGSKSRIEAQGYSHGGSIVVQANGPVDVKRGAFMGSGSGNGFAWGTSSKSSVIQIEGSLVNMEGVLNATSMNQDGGTVRLTGNGKTSLGPVNMVLQDAVGGGNLSTREAEAINNRLKDLQNRYDGDVRIASRSGSLAAAEIAADGGSNHALDSYLVGQGGDIVLFAQRDVLNGGNLTANGGQGLVFKSDSVFGASGGTVNVTAGRNIHNSARIVTDGGSSGKDRPDFGSNSPGAGGLQSYQYGGGLFNNGVLRAHGGIHPDGSTVNGSKGGTIVFKSLYTPLGNGIVSTLGSPGTGNNGLGIIFAPNPAASTNRLFGRWENTATTSADSAETP